ncbi:formate dehydrogenase accessory sulfurtransferase FdhD [Paenibacillus allorhizosphaerae]|uniref:Sulfur carrier protein FdhD n=1 Tax=Paenibacillus allorhizosphaerae TaxID=2849866 RepID=A0ABM8VAP4_9BACL|nr:formate dehydrogenase accessory sulfurtransferase FdhD [Paenibacillus allorhizosphaerae]CAG7615528.1 Sulfur carrier protein FdhD [Paenibacillus allorhizosphaerae]
MKRSVTGIWDIVKYDGDTFFRQEDEIVTEAPLTIEIDGEEFATIVCSPDDLTDMVVGFLAAEGFIRSMEDVNDINIMEDQGFAYIELKRTSSIFKNSYGKRFIGSCCGKSRPFYFYNDLRTAQASKSDTALTAEQCLYLIRQLQEQSAEFQRTGGLHNAGLCSTQELLFTRSDIGRHNALDKIYGHCIRNGVSTADKVIAFSGRISSEVILKVAKIGAGILLSKSAPTDLALQLATELNITAIGFARNGKLNVYTHPQRIFGIDRTDDAEES